MPSSEKNSYSRLGQTDKTDRTRTRAAAIVVVALSALIAPAAAEPLTGRASVIDGDTIEIHGQRIRLEGIDAPESRQTCAEKVGQLDPVISGQVDQKLPCGRRAAFFLADMIGERPVTCIPVGRDRYRRVLAHCAVGGEDTGRALVRAGWALAFVRYSREYIADEEAARQAGVGLWSMQFEPPWGGRASRRRSPSPPP